MHKLTKLLEFGLALGSLFILTDVNQPSIHASSNATQSRVEINNHKRPAFKSRLNVNHKVQNRRSNQRRALVNRPKATNYRRVNYYSRIANYHSHRNGYPIYSNNYFKPGHFENKPIAYQHQIRNQVAHIVKTARVNHQLWVNFKSKVSGWMNSRGISNSTRWFYVPLISQRPQLPTGCEITATTMMLKHVAGKRVNKMKLAREMPRSSNPNRGFIGSPYKSSGWYIYPNGLRGIVNKYTHHHAWNMTGDSNSKIKKQINKGRPVVIWMADIDGFPNHALTVYGYNKNHLFMNDPWRDERRSLSLPYINAHRRLDAWRALSYK